MIISPWILTRDINGYNGFGLSFSNSKYSATIATTTDTSLAVPYSSALYASTSSRQQFVAIFSFAPGAKVWVALNAAAAIPSSSSFAASNSELNPNARTVIAGDTLHFYTSDSSGADVGVSFYTLLK